MDADLLSVEFLLILSRIFFSESDFNYIAALCPYNYYFLTFPEFEKVIHAFI